jgi:hypothetical protein
MLVGLQALTKPVPDLGWHVQIDMTAEGILENLERITDLRLLGA